MADGRGASGGIYALLVIVVGLLVVLILFMTGVLGSPREADTGPDLEVEIETPQAPGTGTGN